MIVNVHDSKEGIIVVVCDSDLLGKRFEEGEKQLDLSSDFYKGEEKSDREIADLMRNAHIVHLVGEKSFDLGIKEGIIEPENKVVVQGVPHAESIIMEE